VVKGGKFEIDATDQDHIYSVYWTLTVKVKDKNGNPVKSAEVSISEISGLNAFHAKTDDTGIISTELLEYAMNGKEKKISSPYTVSVGDTKKVIELDGNKEVVFP
jgi:hypothetical protein